jgi:hypothetical protein
MKCNDITDIFCIGFILISIAFCEWFVDSVAKFFG